MSFTVNIPRYVCPKGHEQNFTFQPMAIAGERPTKQVCIRCYMAWAAEQFPTSAVETGEAKP